jgi:hypothetical protein
MYNTRKRVKKPQKIPTIIYLDPSIREMLRTLALHLYNLEKGSLSKVVEEAIEHYYNQVLNPAENPSTSTKPRSLRVQEAFKLVLSCIKEKYKYNSIHEIDQATQRDLELCISQTLGRSRPTIRHYIELFTKHGYIRKINPAVYEVNP